MEFFYDELLLIHLIFQTLFSFLASFHLFFELSDEALVSL